MEYCERCTNYERHEHLENCARCYLDYVSNEHKTIPIYFHHKTNADRIRAMSDEELAEFLEDENWLCSTYNCCSECPMKGEGTKCLSVLEWLKQTAEDGA